MKSFSFLLLFLSIKTAIFCQCPPGAVVLSSQAEIDDFVATYPNCDQIDGNLTLGSAFVAGPSDPMDLSGLASLNEITGTLRILQTEGADENNNRIPGSLEGLENIESVRSLLIGTTLGSFIYRFESLAPLNGISGDLDSLFIERVFPDSDLPAFENITGIGYYRQDLLLGVESSPTFPNVTYLGDMTFAGGGGEFSEDDLMTTIVIPSQLESISTVEGDFNFPNGGLFIFNNVSASEVVGGENLSFLQAISINNNFNLEDLSGLSEVTTISSGGLSISSNVAGIFDSFQNLEGFDDPDAGIDLSLTNDLDECSESIGTVVFSVSSLTQGDQNQDFTLSISASCGENISVTGNFNELKELRITALEANSLSGFANLDSITDGSLILMVPKLIQLPNFESLVHIEENFRLPVNNQLGWQLEDLTGLNSLQSIGGNLEIGSGGGIGGEFFTNLSGLESLSTVIGDVRIRRLEALSDVSALNNLVSAGELRFQDLAALSSPPEMTSLTSCQEILIDETGLTSLPAFPSLTVLNGDIEIRDNPALTSLNGFVNLEQMVGGISVTSNPVLTSVDLPAEMDFGGEIIAIDNIALADCGSSESLCNIVTQAIFVTFSGNGTDCNVPGDILASCQTLSTNDIDKSFFWARTVGDHILITSDRHIENARIDIFSIDGRKIFSDQMSISIGETLIQSPSTPDGVYLLRIEGDGFQHAEKLLLH